MKMTCYRSITVARQDLERLGVERGFFDPTDQPSADQQLQQSPVLVLTSLEGNSARAIVVLYSLSHEIGLWVRPDLRSHGLGTQMMKATLADKDIGAGRGPIYARTSIRPTSPGPAMRKILERNSFRRVTSGSCLDLWIFYR